jgi:hypothetical protein
MQFDVFLNFGAVVFVEKSRHISGLHRTHKRDGTISFKPTKWSGRLVSTPVGRTACVGAGGSSQAGRVMSARPTKQWQNDVRSSLSCVTLALALSST